MQKTTLPTSIELAHPSYLARVWRRVQMIGRELGKEWYAYCIRKWNIMHEYVVDEGYATYIILIYLFNLPNYSFHWGFEWSQQM